MHKENVIFILIIVWYVWSTDSCVMSVNLKLLIFKEFNKEERQFLQEYSFKLKEIIVVQKSTQPWKSTLQAINIVCVNI